MQGTCPGSLSSMEPQELNANITLTVTDHVKWASGMLDRCSWSMHSSMRVILVEEGLPWMVRVSQHVLARKCGHLRVVPGPRQCCLSDAGLSER